MTSDWTGIKIDGPFTNIYWTDYSFCFTTPNGKYKFLIYPNHNGHSGIKINKSLDKLMVTDGYEHNDDSNDDSEDEHNDDSNDDSEDDHTDYENDDIDDDKFFERRVLNRYATIVYQKHGHDSYSFILKFNNYDKKKVMNHVPIFVDFFSKHNGYYSSRLELRCDDSVIFYTSF